MRRTKAINDKNDLRETEAQMEAEDQRLDDTHGVWVDNMMDGFMAQNADIANSEQRNNARRTQETEGLMSGVLQDLELTEMRDAAQQELDDNDDHAAAESSRLKRPTGQGQGGGRPKKSRIAVTALMMQSMPNCFLLFLSLSVCSFECVPLLLSFVS